MSFLSTSRNRLVLVLWLVGIHSIVVGFGLIFLPPSYVPFFGFAPFAEKFFPVQGGVFHLVMAVAYIMAAVRPERYPGLIILSFVAKLMAAAFLLTYYILIDRIWMVLFSGVGDALMGLVIYLLYRAFNRETAS
ncbi:MAG: hypothetical protein AB1483_13875 [Candidatus Zixiibacteriota bacterium]